MLFFQGFIYTTVPKYITDYLGETAWRFNSKLLRGIDYYEIMS